LALTERITIAIDISSVQIADLGTRVVPSSHVALRKAELMETLPGRDGIDISLAQVSAISGCLSQNRRSAVFDHGLGHITDEAFAGADTVDVSLAQIGHDVVLLGVD
jgi:hypothetical protein